MPREPLKPFRKEERADAVIRVVHPAIAAEKLRISLAEVLSRRRELGLPTVDEQFTRPLRGRLRECAD
jgi:hypothetical protein